MSARGMGPSGPNARQSLESARMQSRRLLGLAMAAGTRKSKKQLMERAFAWAQLAAVMEEEVLTPPPAPIIWPRNPPARRRNGRGD